MIFANDSLKEYKDELNEVSDSIFLRIYEKGYNAGFAAAETNNSCAFCNIGKSFSALGRRLNAPSKTANQQRNELILRAKEFLKANIYRRREHCGLDGDNISVDYKFLKLKFVVNAEKRTVVALLFFPGGIIYRRAIAKCHPDEVFNEWIGKAIALARVLEIDIPSVFLNAVQPTEFVFGTVGRWTRKHDNYTLETVIDRDIDEDDLHSSNKDLNNNDTDWSAIIIDDTNAEYSL